MPAALSHLISEAYLAVEAETPDQYRDRTGRCPRGYRFAQDKDRCLTKQGVSKTEPSTEKETFAPSPEKVEAMAKHVDAVDKALGLNPIEAYRNRASLPTVLRDEFDRLPKESQFLISTAQAASYEFEHSVVKKKPFHDRVCGAWAEDTSAIDAHRIQGALAAKGVNGSPAPDDPDASSVRKEGADSQDFNDWIDDVQAFTQAYLKKHGIEEVTVYRGVKGQLEGVEKGDDIGIACREASSFSLSPRQAKRFSDNVIAMKVPASRILMTPVTSSELVALGEHEIVVMGASDLKGVLV
jgi:hypothetical protein